MENWTDICRCCLSAKSKVSILDNEQSISEKFFEVTTIQVKADDGLPQKLCGDCYLSLNSAYKFRKQCIKMDTELKVQLNDLLSQCIESNIDNSKKVPENDTPDAEFTNNPMKQPEEVIKKEPMDSDDDYYYVLVIDNPKDEENGDDLHPNVVKDEGIDLTQIKFEPASTDSKDLIASNILPEEEPVEILATISDQHTDDTTQNTDFENAMNSFLMTNNILANVPATILENEESQDNNDNGMDIGETQNMNNEELNYEADENAQDNFVGEITDPNLIKILTTGAQDGTILLKSDGVVQYLTDDQLVMNEEDGEQSQEVIYCEGDESQFQIVKYDGSELVIEYADESSIATALQNTTEKYVCDCGEEFDNATEMENHQKTHNAPDSHLCNLCGKGFETADILTGHIILHNVPGNIINCPFCDQSVKRSMLTQHIKYGHNNVKPKCDKCGKTFANPNNLKRHMVIHTGVKEFACNICSKRFHQKITMQTHILTHMNSFECFQCDKQFIDKAALEQHKASLCPMTTTKESKEAKEEIMKTVKQKITTNLGKLLGYACSLCKKMFSVEAALDCHIEATHIVDPMELLCSTCGEVCNSKKEMQVHALTHKRKSFKRFECSICFKSCSSHAMLIMHERVHTNERPFSCQLCPLKFKTKTHLRTHQLTHTREKKFGCSVCMKFFALKGNLVVHLRTHTGERPYVCSICGESFIDSKYLKKHTLKKHEESNVTAELDNYKVYKYESVPINFE